MLQVPFGLVILYDRKTPVVVIAGFTTEKLICRGGTFVVILLVTGVAEAQAHVPAIVTSTTLLSPGLLNSGV